MRNMDWIYRNIPGAKVERRTHQSLSVPEQPGQTVYQTLIDLEVQVPPPRDLRAHGAEVLVKGCRAAPAD